MSATLPFPPPVDKSLLPTHLDLPDSDGIPVNNFAEPLQSVILESSLKPVLERLHPDGMYLIGRDSGIYYRITDPPLDGCKSPDWFYIPGVNPAASDAPYRRSYVLWQDEIKPKVVIEYISDNEGKEWDETPETGKFWVYENVFEVDYYAIHDHETGDVEVFQRQRGKLKKMKPNEHGRYPISTFGVELGTKKEDLEGQDVFWLRWFRPDGTMLPSDAERVRTLEAQKKKLADKLRELGINPDSL